ncbi:hypothetical protein ABIF27_009091, partial [Bradyrhizobium elkanii]
VAYRILAYRFDFPEAVSQDTPSHDPSFPAE